MNEITVCLGHGVVIQVQGELVLDAQANSLIIYGESGSYMNFYWPGVAYYAVNNGNIKTGQTEEDN